jgi:hypothetical protein
MELSRRVLQRVGVMNAFASYLRHLIVTAILLAVEKLQLPIEGADKAADAVALLVVGTLSWWFVKYIAPKLKVPKGSGLALFALAVSLALLTPSCSNLNPDQNDRLIDAAERVIIYVAK